jgi:hypothetical protein
MEAQRHSSWGLAPTVLAGVLLMAAPGPAWAASIAFPVRTHVSDAIALVPTDDGLYVVIPESNRDDDWVSSVVVALDHGRPRAGWPIRLPGACRLAPSDVDSSTRVLCDQVGLGPRAFAFDRSGRSLPGWPVFVGGSATDAIDGVVVEGDLVALTSNGSVVRLVRVAPDGSARAGVPVNAGGWSGRRCPECSTDVGPAGVAPDGTGYLVTYLVERWPGGGRAVGTRLNLFDLGGPRPGWPIRIDVAASGPAFGPHRRMYLTQGSGEAGPTRLVVLDRSGRPVPGLGARLPLPLPIEDGYWEGLRPILAIGPMVADDGSTVVAVSGMGTTAYRIDAAGRYRSGATYRSSAPAEEIDTWKWTCTAPGWALPAWPALSSDGTLYLLQHATSARAGGSAVAVDPDGRVKSGWPVTLRHAGAQFLSATPGRNGSVYLLAIEPVAAPRARGCPPDSWYSATILELSPSGAVRSRTTVVAP